jgi:starch synthase
VVDVNPATISAKSARGFLFDDYAPTALVTAVKRALAAFADRPLWLSLMRTGMRQDFSWEQSARAYVQVYERALSKRVA